MVILEQGGMRRFHSVLTKEAAELLFAKIRLKCHCAFWNTGLAVSQQIRRGRVVYSLSLPSKSEVLVPPVLAMVVPHFTFANIRGK